MSSNADSPISLNSLDINDFDTPTDRIKASAFLASVTTVLDDKQPCRTDYLVQELLTSAHPRRCFEVLRMSIDTFYALRDWLLANTELRSSRKVEGVTIGRKFRYNRDFLLLTRVWKHRQFEDSVTSEIGR